MPEPEVVSAALGFGAKEVILGLGTAVISLLQWINRKQIADLKADNARIEKDLKADNVRIEKKLDDAIKDVKGDAEKEQEKSRQHFMKIYTKLEEIQISIAELKPRQN